MFFFQNIPPILVELYIFAAPARGGRASTKKHRAVLFGKSSNTKTVV